MKQCHDHLHSLGKVTKPKHLKFNRLMHSNKIYMDIYIYLIIAKPNKGMKH